MTIPVPVLSPAGWVTEPSAKADALTSHIFEADFSQSFIYNGKVTSLQYLIEQYGDNMIKLTQEVQSALEAYFGRYYDSATAEVTNNDNSANTGTAVTLYIYVGVTENGNSYSIGKEVSINNSKVTSIADINNG